MTETLVVVGTLVVLLLFLLYHFGCASLKRSDRNENVQLLLKKSDWDDSIITEQNRQIALLKESLRDVTVERNALLSRLEHIGPAQGETDTFGANVVVLRRSGEGK